MGKLKCRNMSCPKYDSEFARRAGPQMVFRSPAPLPAFSGKFDPGPDRLEIRYRNFRGDEQTYLGDLRTLRRRGEYISICLAPTGRRAAFALKWIQSPKDLREVAEKNVQEAPTPRERRVLSYHKKKGTTSPLYETLRRKYPDF